MLESTFQIRGQVSRYSSQHQLVNVRESFSFLLPGVACYKFSRCLRKCFESESGRVKLFPDSLTVICQQRVVIETSALGGQSSEESL